MLAEIDEPIFLRRRKARSFSPIAYFVRRRF
jgi:hypothetical protein